jgi:hypothetical protein
MTNRSSGSRCQKVLDARRHSREALGLDPRQGSLFDGPPSGKSTTYGPLSAPSAEPRKRESIGVLIRGEGANRLGITRRELEAMIATGKIESLPADYSPMIPTREVESLLTHPRDLQ